MFTRIGKGMVAGFIATLVLSALMIIKSAMGLMPEVNAIAMLTKISNGALGTPATPLIGWVEHFLIGTVLWGGLYALLAGYLGRSAHWQRAMIFSVAAWLLMMILVMPMAGAGLFGMNLGVGAPIATLVLHLIFGAVLGGVYSWLLSPADEAAPVHEHHGKTAGHHH